MTPETLSFRPLVLGAGALVALSLAGVGAARLGLAPSPETRPVIAVEPAVSQQLRFRDAEGGAVLVEPVGAGRLVVLEPGAHGFIRVVVRGLARERRLRGIGPEPAFRLTHWSNGRLTLDDPATGRSVKLEGFGATNRQAFMDLLEQTREAT